MPLLRYEFGVAGGLASRDGAQLQGTELGRRKRRLLDAALAARARQSRPGPGDPGGLSPYLHFGHIGAREVALAVNEAPISVADRSAFLEEVIVRRELAVNYVHYNPAYDSLKGCKRWAQETLKRHARDARQLVPVRRLMAAESPEPLWNAAQAQMIETGSVFGKIGICLRP